MGQWWLFEKRVVFHSVAQALRGGTHKHKTIVHSCNIVLCSLAPQAGELSKTVGGMIDINAGGPSRTKMAPFFHRTWYLAEPSEGAQELSKLVVFLWSGGTPQCPSQEDVLYEGSERASAPATVSKTGICELNWSQQLGHHTFQKPWLLQFFSRR